MSIYKANKEITGVYVGITQISNAYIGSSQIYGGGSVSVDGVKFTAKQSNSTVGLNKLASFQTIEYSYDGNTWNSMTTSTTITLTNIGDSFYVRGVLSSSNSGSNYTQFKITGNIKASGNINYLWNKDNPDAALRWYCGYALFSGCTALTDVVDLELQSTTLANYCYMAMFRGCTSLTTAPVLPATTLNNFCYAQMFNGCTNLNYIKCLATNISANGCTTNWVMNVAASGTFVKDANMTGWSRGTEGIPSGWTVTDA